LTRRVTSIPGARGLEARVMDGKLIAACALAGLMVPTVALAQTPAPVAEAPAPPVPAEPAKPQEAMSPAPAPMQTSTVVAASGQTSNDEPARCEERPWRFGGTLGVVSLPRFLSLEFLARYKSRWGFGAMVEYLPRGVANFGDVTTVSWFQAGANARYFFTKSLFAGAGVGYQFSRAHSEKFGSEVDYVTSGLFLAPRAGILHTFGNGLAIGGDLGVTIPLFPGEKEISDGQTDANGRKVSKTFGQFVMPFVSLFRIGYFF
jgi:hypothetical protein